MIKNLICSWFMGPFWAILGLLWALPTIMILIDLVSYIKKSSHLQIIEKILKNGNFRVFNVILDSHI